MKVSFVGILTVKKGGCMVQLFYNRGRRKNGKEREEERERQNKERQTFILNKMQVRIAFCLCPYQGVDYK